MHQFELQNWAGSLKVVPR